MVILFKVSIVMESQMEKAFTPGKMVNHTMESGIAGASKVMESGKASRATVILVHGRATKLTAMGYTPR
jgi:hypothetical protein